MENNFKKEINEFKKDINSNSLSFKEKQILKSNIFNEIGINKKISNNYSMLSPNMFRISFATIIIFILIGGPVVFASNQSLPGDALYSMKTNFNEKAIGTFVRKENKVNYNVKLAQKRFEELGELVETQTVDEEKLLLIEEKLKEHSEDISKNTQDYSVVENIENQENLLTVLKTYKEVASHFKEETTEINTIIENTEIEISDSIDILVETDSEENIDSVLDNHISETKDNLNKTSETIGGVNGEKLADDINDILPEVETVFSNTSDDLEDSTEDKKEFINVLIKKSSDINAKRESHKIILQSKSNISESK